MQSENRQSNPRWEKYAKALLATTCLGVASSATASAATILIVEGTSPAPADFPNTAPGFVLARGTNLVQGRLTPTTDQSDWFEFQALDPGHSFSVVGVYNPLHQERGVSFQVFNSSLQQLGSATLEGLGEAVFGTIPSNGILDVHVQFGQTAGPAPTYQISLTAELGPAPEPAPVLGVGLGLAGALAWRRRRASQADA